jgi:hypothetical protein
VDVGVRAVVCSACRVLRDEIGRGLALRLWCKVHCYRMCSAMMKEGATVEVVFHVFTTALLTDIKIYTAPSHAQARDHHDCLAIGFHPILPSGWWASL